MAHLFGKRIVIAGGSGFLGLSMAEHFSRDDALVTILSRSKPKADGRWSHCFWDGRTLGDWVSALEGADAVQPSRKVNYRISAASSCAPALLSVETAVPVEGH